MLNQKCLLKLENLSVGYGLKEIISSINAEMNKGEMIGLIGKNGSGKSTLLNTILGFQKKLEGNIYIKEKDISSFSNAKLATEIAVVLPKMKYIPMVKVREIVAMGRLPYHYGAFRLTKEEEDKITLALELVGMEDYSYQYVNHLSDGQLQMVMIARALVQDASMIILDEPTSNLDVENQYKIFELIHHLRAETQKGFLIATHELELAMLKVDRLWWIENGKMHTGMPEQIAFEQNIYEKLSGNKLYFEQSSDRYRFKSNTNRQIKVVGEGTLSYWVKQAFVRNQFEVSDEATREVRIVENTILYKDEANEIVFDNIEDLFIHIHRLFLSEK